MADVVPIIDLTPWFSGDADGRAAVAAQVDAALQDVGFLLVTGHGVPVQLRDAVRRAARAFFAQPAAVKRRTSPYGRCTNRSRPSICVFAG